MAQFHEQDEGRGSGRISHPGPTLVRRCAVRAAFCLVLPLLLLAAGCPQPAAVPEEKPAAAQEPDAVDERPPYPVVQDPETNGYHELLLAAARLRRAPKFEAPAPNPSPAQARAAVASPAGTETVALVRQALRKPVDYPLAERYANTPFPEERDFRSIAHLLAQRYRVQCTDEDWGEAAETFETGVQLVSVIPTDFAIGLMLQAAMQHTVLSAPALRRNGLPADHCRRLIRLCRRCPTGREEVRRALHGEVDVMQRTLADPVRGMGMEPAKAAAAADLFAEGVEALEAIREEFTGLVDLTRRNGRRPGFLRTSLSRRRA